MLIYLSESKVILNRSAFFIVIIPKLSVLMPVQSQFHVFCVCNNPVHVTVMELVQLSVVLFSAFDFISKIICKFFNACFIQKNLLFSPIPVFNSFLGFLNVLIELFSFIYHLILNLFGLVPVTVIRCFSNIFYHFTLFFSDIPLLIL